MLFLFSALAEQDKIRHHELRQVGNMLHPSVIISDNEVWNICALTCFPSPHYFPLSQR